MDNLWRKIAPAYLIVPLAHIMDRTLLEVGHVYINRDSLRLPIKFTVPTLRLGVRRIKSLNFFFFELLSNPDLKVVILSPLAHQQVIMDALAGLHREWPWCFQVYAHRKWLFYIKLKVCHRNLRILILATQHVRKDLAAHRFRSRRLRIGYRTSEGHRQ